MLFDSILVCTLLSPLWLWHRAPSRVPQLPTALPHPISAPRHALMHTQPNPAAAFDKEDEPGDEDVALEKHRQEMEALGVRTFMVSCGKKPGLLLLPETYSTSFLVVSGSCRACFA